MSNSRPSWPYALIALLVLGALGATGWYVYAGNNPAIPESGMLDHQAFTCYGVSESARTVAPARLERKAIQVRRIRRLLDSGRLEPLDAAKLEAELAILLWDMEDARFLRDCAEAWYRPGSTHVRDTFDEARPPAFDPAEAKAAYVQALDKTSPRMLPHGFEERAKLHLAQAAIVLDTPREAREIANAHLEAHPDGLYADAFQLVAADAAILLGDSREAIALYREVGKLKIGPDAHYARYRLARLLEASGNTSEAGGLMEDVERWADRGDREALLRVLKQEP